MTTRTFQTKRVTVPTVVLAASLLVASTGGAVAGTMITGKQIKDGTVTTADIKDRSLKTNDFSPAARTALRGRTGTRGPAGATGQTGPAGLAAVETVSESTDVAANTPASKFGACPSGKTMLSATGYWNVSRDAVQVYYSSEASAILYSSGVPTADTLTIQLICAATTG